MINLLKKGWLSYQFSAAMKKGDRRQATKLLRQLKNHGISLSWQQHLYRDYLSLKLTLEQQDKSIQNLNKKVETIDLKSNTLNIPSDFLGDDSILLPDSKVIQNIIQDFNIIKHNASMLQCTGIDPIVFDEIETHLADFIQTELNQYCKKSNFKTLLNDAVQDLNKLKSGQDPSYSFELSPHIYLMRYFLEHIYCAYLAWFLIYQSGQLPTHLNILDIAAGPSTVAYGLDLFLETLQKRIDLPTTQISYYSLEKQDKFQYRGLQFWRRYIEQKQNPSNIYFRFDTQDFFNNPENFKKIPHQFFDFVVISHCLFYDLQTRSKFNIIFNQVFLKSLKSDGFVLLIIQDKKLFQAYNLNPCEHSDQESEIIDNLLAAMGLKLVWYKYLSSTNQRGAMKGREFAKFADDYLPPQLKMSQLANKYLGLKYNLNYKLDDYVILAQKS
ncbi:MAG: photosystem II assembly protein [Microcoleaceae cyanobacterium]